MMNKTLLCKIQTDIRINAILCFEVKKTQPTADPYDQQI